MSRWALAVCLLLPACGGTTTTGTASASGGSSGSGGGEPQVHRSMQTSCQAPPKPLGPPVAEPDPFHPCASDAECLGGFNGRCVLQRTGMSCVYDDCYSDDQCTDGAVCECRGATVGNACLPSGCRVDADCPGSWCSPTAGTCGAYWGTIGYQCHTPQDECTDDADCVAPPGMGGAGYCMHAPAAGRWICGYTQCVG